MTNKKFLIYPSTNERFYECVICQEAIYNPLCPVCILEQIEAWLTIYPDLSRKLIPKVKKYLIAVHNCSEELMECVSCKRKQASICPYCFTEFILSQLKRLEVNKLILKEFLQFFNFDFEHSGYTEEAEKLGLY